MHLDVQADAAVNTSANEGPLTRGSENSVGHEAVQQACSALVALGSHKLR